MSSTKQQQPSSSLPRPESSSKQLQHGTLSRMEIFNFKSWSGQHVVGPFSEGFSSIIGPNGSGKSNTLDAIVFAMNAASTKKLRGDSLKDLIYDGDKKASITNREASVSLVYALKENEIPGAREGEEISFKRSIRYSDVGSTYEYNGKRVSHEMYTQKLEALGILAEASNFIVLQGQVESVAQMAPMDLTKFIELLSGSGMYAELFKQRQAEKEAAESATLTALARRKEITAERKEAKGQAAETNRHRELVQERENVRIQQALFNIYYQNKEIEHYNTLLQAANETLEEVKITESTMIEELKKAKAQSAAKTREVAKAESLMQKNSKLVATETNKHVKKLEELARSRLKKRDAEVTLRQVNEMAEKQAEEIRELKAGIETMANKEKELLQESVTSNAAAAAAASAGGSSALTSQQQSQLSQIRQRADMETATIRAELQRVEREADIVQDRLNLVVRGETQLEQRKEELKQERNGLIKRMQKMEASTSQLHQKVQEIQQNKLQEDARMEQVRKTLENKQAELTQAKSLLNNAKARSTETKRNKKLQETVSTLSRHFPGVFGMLLSLIKVTRDGYETAVETALGKHLESIVVDRESTAIECIKYLREQRLMVCTFIPLDTVRVKPISEVIRTICSQQNNNYNLTLDLLDYDNEAIARAVQFAAGDSIICQTLADARRLRFQDRIRVKAITKEGHFISTRGEMTGGATVFSETRVDRFSEKALQTARETRDHLEQEIQDLERQLSSSHSQADLDVAIQNAMNRLKYANGDLDSSRKKIDEVDAAIADVDKALHESLPKRTELENKLTSLTTRMETLKGQITQIEDGIFTEMGINITSGENNALVSNFREWERRETEQVTKRQRDLAEVTDQLRKLEAQLRYVESRDRNKPIQDAQVILTKIISEIEKLEEETTKLKRTLDEIEEQAEQAKITHGKAVHELEALTSKVKEAQTRITERSKERADVARKVSSLEAQTQTAKALKNEIARQAALDGLELPTISTSSSNSASKKRKSMADVDDDEQDDSSSPSSSNTPRPITPPKSEEQSSTSSSSSSQHGSLSESMLVLKSNAEFDFSILDDKLKALVTPTKSTSTSANKETNIKFMEKDKEFTTRIKEISEEIETLAPNARAETKLQDANQRLKDFDTQLNEAREAAKVADEAFAQVRQQRYDAFMNMFNHVSEQIDPTYKELTKRENAPLGGSAFLALEDSQDPYFGGIKFDCMPPNKRFRVMESLSGGEKTVAALALLFALHSYRPSPFFILDEVDAALDNDNVGRVSNYIRRRSRRDVEQDQQQSLEFPTQFIVISLKDNFYDKSDVLVGVYREQNQDTSESVTLDLSTYDF
jgi:structural maintenance of chromosome 1